MPGPDFPLPNTIINKKDVRAAYATGHSAVSLKVCGEYEIKGQDLIFTTIPYRAYRNKIKEQIEKNGENTSQKGFGLATSPFEEFFSKKL